MGRQIEFRAEVDGVVNRLTSFVRFWGAEPHNESGSAMVEFALSVVVLFTVTFGIMAVSLAIYSYTFVSDAARGATRYAMVRGSTLGTDCVAPGYATCIAQPADIQAYVRAMSFPGIDTSKVTVTSTWLTSAGVSCGTIDTCKDPGNIVRVQVRYPYPLRIPFVPASTLNLVGTSQIVIAQ